MLMMGLWQQLLAFVVLRRYDAIAFCPGYSSCLFQPACVFIFCDVFLSLLLRSCVTNTCSLMQLASLCSGEIKCAELIVFLESGLVLSQW
jgi:hypothetical protein